MDGGSPSWGDRWMVCPQVRGTLGACEPNLEEPAASCTKHPCVHRDRKWISGFQGLGAEGSGYKVSVWGDGHVLELVVCSPNIECAESHWTVRCKVVRMWILLQVFKKQEKLKANK